MNPVPARNKLVTLIRARVVTWVALAVLVAGVHAGGRGWLVAAAALASFRALREMLTLAYTRRADHWALFAAFFLVLPVHYVLIGIGWYGFYAIFIPVYAFLLLPVLSAFRGDPSRFLDRVAEVQWGVMICVYCLSYLPALLALDIPGFAGRQLLLVCFLLIIVEASAVIELALAGNSQPQKGSAPPFSAMGAAMILAAAIGALLSALTPYSAPIAALMAAAIAAMGSAGSIVMAAIRRDRGALDWPGGGSIGGMLERIERLVFAAPILFHLTRFFYGA